MSKKNISKDIWNFHSKIGKARKRPADEQLSFYFDTISSDWDRLISITGHNPGLIRNPHHGVRITSADDFVLFDYDEIIDSYIMGSKPTAPAEVVDISDLFVSEKGVVSEQWEKIENISAIVVGNSGDQVTLECLIDEEKKLFERRIFPAPLLKGVVKLEEGSLILIKIFQRPGEMKFKFVSGKGIVRPEVFQKTDAIGKVFKNIAKGKFDKHYKGEPR